MGKNPEAKLLGKLNCNITVLYCYLAYSINGYDENCFAM
jgi:hypothetical protein